jgi:hypothetical protein
MDTTKERTGLCLRTDPVLRWLRAGVIGRGATLPTSEGPRRKRYFDQTASGLPFAPIEELIRDRVLPMMTNTHTEATTCARFMTEQYEEAHRKARRALGAAADDIVIFTGSGATGAINKLIGLLGLRMPGNRAAANTGTKRAGPWSSAAAWSTTPTICPGARPSPTRSTSATTPSGGPTGAISRASCALPATGIAS